MARVKGLETTKKEASPTKRTTREDTASKASGIEIKEPFDGYEGDESDAKPSRSFSKVGRSGEGREHEDRKYDQRDNDPVDAKGRFWIDETKIPDGMVLGWVVTDILGKPEPDFMDKAFDRGWEPVSRQTLAQFSNKKRSDTLKSVFGSNYREDQYIRRGGQILCMRPKWMNDKEQAGYRQRNIENKRLAQMNDGILFKDVDSVTYGPLEAGGGYNQFRRDD